MKNTTFISAGAGSGKTYTLSQKVVELVSSKQCRANEIILSTFTVVAADELRERVRAALYKAGLFEDAVLLDNAAIGTIHSIAFQLVKKYWYLAGVSADVQILPEENQKYLIDTSLSKLVDQAQLFGFNSICDSLKITKTENHITRKNADFWKDDLKDIIGKINNCNIDREELDAAAVRSKEYVKKILGTRDGIHVDKSVVQRACGYLEELFKEFSTTNKNKLTSDFIAIKRCAYNKDVSAIPFVDLLSVANFITGPMPEKHRTGREDMVEFFERLKSNIPISKTLYDLLEGYIDKVFAIAKEWQREYAEFKAERRLLDYNDIQECFLTLLQNKQVEEEFRSSYKVALVDEFQDCSPLQIKCFDRISELMLRSFWVGDLKQAIYDFRGTDTSLVQEVIAEVGKGENGNNLAKPLEHCWRSNRSIVEQTGNLFCNVFTHLPEEFVRLEMPPRKEGEKEPRNMTPQLWTITGSNDSQRSLQLVQQIVGLHKDKGFEYKDIAVIYKNNDPMVAMAKVAQSVGVPCNVVTDRVYTDEESDKVWGATIAILSAVADNNNLAKTIVARYFQPGCNAGKLLSARMKHCTEGKAEDEWLNEVALVAKINAIRPKVRNQSVASAVETVVVELNVSDLIKLIAPQAVADRYCAKLIESAMGYENRCTTLSLPCSLSGFVEYIKQYPLNKPGDANGVTFTTYHKSKGLEWKCVILCETNNKVSTGSRMMTGVKVKRNEKNTYDMLFFPQGLGDMVVEDRLVEDHEWYQPMYAKQLEEAKRLMYVGMTRPKELLVVTCGQKNEWLDLLTNAPFPTNEPDGAVVEFKGLSLDKTVLTLPEVEDHEPDTTEQAAQSVEQIIPFEQPTTPVAKFVSPSKATRSEEYDIDCTLASFGGKVVSRAEDGSDAHIGDFVHQLMCLYDPNNAEFAEVAKKMAAEYGVVVDHEALVANVEKFWQWLRSTYGEPTSIEREVPFIHQRANAQVVSGEIDLLWHCGDKVVLVDYKTYQGAPSNLTNTESEFCAMKYSGQIGLYEEALTQAGCVVEDRLICYISLGVVARLVKK